ncbi:hypothetical protein TWF694_005941 [Orbilia ellipsospora]|uniref:Uncharacterized protein n=1 Tax=Orbilia ellipsospora TaxID=2528407 RepID=A0AAV9WUV0_9PEZI
MMSVLRTLFTILYLSIFVSALPRAILERDQKPLSPKKFLSGENPNGITCQEDQLICGTICYDPTEAECDPIFETLTRFGPLIANKKKEVANKLAEERQKQKEKEEKKVKSVKQDEEGLEEKTVEVSSDSHDQDL